MSLEISGATADMPPGDRVERLREALWPPPGGASTPKVYGVLDGARDARIHAEVRSSGLPHACLYTGRLPAEMLEIAPYLVALERDAPFTDALLRGGWGQSWGIFAWSTGTLEELRRHLRRFLRVQTEGGERFLFRYYDPRVLRVYLPTCDPGELRALFGPIVMYLVEGEDPDELIRFHRDGDALGRAVARLSGEPGATRGGSSC